VWESRSFRSRPAAGEAAARAPGENALVEVRHARDHQLRGEQLRVTCARGARHGGPPLRVAQRLDERLAVGTPVVAYDDPALVETLAGAGELVPSGDTAALARALSDLLADPERRTRMAEAGNARARDFNFDRALDELRAVYARVAACG
jgi:glycosyltransferase involved in cell wall biosynthesis